MITYTTDKSDAKYWICSAMDSDTLSMSFVQISDGDDIYSGASEEAKRAAPSPELIAYAAIERDRFIADSKALKVKPPRKAAKSIQQIVSVPELALPALPPSAAPAAKVSTAAAELKQRAQDVTAQRECNTNQMSVLGVKWQKGDMQRVYMSQGFASMALKQQGVELTSEISQAIGSARWYYCALSNTLRFDNCFQAMPKVAMDAILAFVALKVPAVKLSN